MANVAAAAPIPATIPAMPAATPRDAATAWKLAVFSGRLGEISGSHAGASLTLTFGLIQSRELPEVWKSTLEQVQQAVAAGAPLYPQTQVRSVGVLFGLVNLTPWDLAGGAWGELRALTLEDKVAALRDPERRARLVADSAKAPLPEEFYRLIYRLSVVDGAARYDFGPDDSLAAHAERRGLSIVEAFIEMSLEGQGRTLFLFPFANYDLDVVAEMLAHPQVLLGLADTGAHCGQIMDASLPTFFLSYWVREKGLLPLERAIQKLSSEPAEIFGLRDRGVVREGAFADLNLIDYEGLRVLLPEYVHDFPAGAGRYVQRAAGFKATIVNGQPFMEEGEHTGALAGHLLRSTD